MFKMHIMSGFSQLKYLVLSILFVIASINFGRTTLDIIQSSKRLDSLKFEVANLQQKKDTLQSDASYRKTTDFIEEKARNELNLIKPGEGVYIMPDSDGKVIEPKPGSVDVSSTVLPNALTEKEIPNWKTWYALFIN